MVDICCYSYQKFVFMVTTNELKGYDNTPSFLTHTLPSHTHTLPSHTHSPLTHTLLTHILSPHTHTLPSHTLSSHTHSPLIHTLSPHTHSLLTHTPSSHTLPPHSSSLYNTIDEVRFRPPFPDPYGTFRSEDFRATKPGRRLNEQPYLDCLGL